MKGTPSTYCDACTSTSYDMYAIFKHTTFTCSSRVSRHPRRAIHHQRGRSLKCIARRRRCRSSRTPIVPASTSNKQCSDTSKEYLVRLNLTHSLGATFCRKYADPFSSSLCKHVQLLLCNSIDDLPLQLKRPRGRAFPPPPRLTPPCSRSAPTLMTGLRKLKSHSLLFIPVACWPNLEFFITTSVDGAVEQNTPLCVENGRTHHASPPLPPGPSPRC